MTENEIHDFFCIKGKEEDFFAGLINESKDEPSFPAEKIIFEILKKTFGYPVSFMDEGKEEIYYLSESKSDAVYQKYAEEINNGYYETLYDFVQELSDYLANCPDAD